MDINALINRLEIEMDEGWTAYANGESTSDEVYHTIDELKEMGLGAVLVPTQRGNLKWLCLESLSF